MTDTNTGGPAFPTTDFTHAGQVIPGSEGMTLRDYFAAKAMQGGVTVGSLPPAYTFDDMAKQAYMMADAMLKARNT